MAKSFQAGTINPKQAEVKKAPTQETPQYALVIDGIVVSEGEAVYGEFQSGKTGIRFVAGGFTYKGKQFGFPFGGFQAMESKGSGTGMKRLSL